MRIGLRVCISQVISPQVMSVVWSEDHDVRNRHWGLVCVCVGGGGGVCEGRKSDRLVVGRVQVEEKFSHC